MKSLLFLTTPTVILIAGCIFLNVLWPYYIIAWAAGNGFGVLALLTWFQLKDNSDRPYIKFYLSKEIKSNKNINHNGGDGRLLQFKKEKKTTGGFR
jgi:hypothetical protein